MSPRLVVVGPPGAGKTTVGGLVAGLLGVPFRDTDDDIERVAGTTIADIFVEHGESHFRALERAAVASALEEHPGVLAVGGGAVLDEGTRARLAGRCVVFLDVGAAEAARRIGLNRDRPLLLGNPRRRWVELMKVRRPIYEQVATLHVDTDGRTPEEIADDIAARVPA